jgi:hypothetical protein
VVEIIALEDGSDDFWLRWPTRLGGPLACELRYPIFYKLLLEKAPLNIKPRLVLINKET